MNLVDLQFSSVVSWKFFAYHRALHQVIQAHSQSSPKSEKYQISWNIFGHFPESSKCKFGDKDLVSLPPLLYVA